MRTKINREKLKNLPTFEEVLVEQYGEKGSVSRDEFDAKAPRRPVQRQDQLLDACRVELGEPEFWLDQPAARRHGSADYLP